ncbi:MAG: polysaccharide deacetylase family protein [Polyangiaceae bacterium]
MKTSTLLCLVVASLGCAEDRTFNAGTGGASSNGGSAPSGGQAAGGASSNGGSGTNATGGNSAAGASTQGGASAGASSLGGSSVGGSSAGGSSAGGGAQGGQSAASGGTNASSGGNAATAGAASGGRSGGASAGGNASQGGASGGAVNRGGATAAGGTSSGGTTGSAGVSDLPKAGSTGVARPSGTAGNLKVLDWAGFKGAVSYTFDDTNSSQIAHYKELQALGVRMTFYLITGKTEANDATWTQAVKDGHELGNHTKSHQSVATAADIDAATDFIKSKFGVTVWTMAAPNGDASYQSFAKTRFLINRGVANGLIAPNDSSDPYNLYCYIPPSGAAASAFNTQIDGARTGNKWRVVLVHGFSGGTDGAYQPVAIGEFTSSVTYAKSTGELWIDSVVNVASYWRGQKAFTSVTPTTSGADKVYSWTLPEHFPPGKYLRVKVDGGTLKQGGNALPWDDHGYYEVALSGGPLTLSP